MLVLPTLEQLDRDLLAAAADEVGGADARRDRAGRRRQGAYFTPMPLVELVAKEALRARLAGAEVGFRDDGSAELVVLDPSAGDGRFLCAAADVLAAEAVRRGVADARDQAAVRAAMIRRCLVGIERDAEFAALARARLPGAAIHCREALLDAPGAATGADVIIGNPPYLRSIHFARADPGLWAALKGRYAATSHGEWDLYAAFVEQAMEWASPAGEIGLVVPSRWLTAGFARGLRDKLARAGAVRALVDFGSRQIFPGATTYASVVFLSRARAQARMLPPSVRPSALAPASGAAAPAPADAGVAVARHTAAGWRIGHVAAHSLSAAPWRLSVGERRRWLDALSRDAPQLGQIARIVKGAGTNADRVFVLEQAERAGELVRGRSSLLGEMVELEAAACRPCLRGRDVRPWGAVDGRVWCIVPYEPDGALWSPERLAGCYPRAHGYLLRCRDALEARERGRFRGERFYCFGRPQNLAFLADTAAKIVVPDVARGGRALCDTRGALVLDSAYALRLRSPAGGHALGLGVDLGLGHALGLPVLLAVLNSPVVGWWLAETGVLLRGGYVRLKTASLGTLPLPVPSPATERLAARASAAGAADDSAELTELVRQAYALDPAQWRDMAAH